MNVDEIICFVDRQFDRLVRAKDACFESPVDERCSFGAAIALQRVAFDLLPMKEWCRPSGCKLRLAMDLMFEERQLLRGRK